MAALAPRSESPGQVVPRMAGGSDAQPMPTTTKDLDAAVGVLPSTDDGARLLDIDVHLCNKIVDGGEVDLIA